MDCNNYSYSPDMLDSMIISQYSNDDMSITHKRSTNKNIVSSYSYDGHLDTYDEFNSQTIAAELFAHIATNYANAAPDNRRLNAYIRGLHQKDRKSA